MKLAAIIAISLSALALAAPAAPTKHSTEKQGKDPAQDFAKSLLGDVGKALKLLSVRVYSPCLCHLTLEWKLMGGDTQP
jgi:hypothetical protein